MGELGGIEGGNTVVGVYYLREEYIFNKRRRGRDRIMKAKG